MDTPPSNPDSETPEVEALRAEIHTLQQAWEDTRTQRDELLAHIKDGAPLPEWAAKWIATFAGQSHTRAYTQLDPKPVIEGLRELADLLESGRLVYGSGGLSFSGSQESVTLNANLTLKRQPKG